jgi:parvulin-like peptidyl-prolyl isomerase
MLNTIRENAKWFVAVPIACFAALIFVDWGMSPGNDMTQKNIVGKIEGEKVSFASFDKEVESEAKKLTSEGQELDAGQYANIRAEVFEKFVRSQILQKDFEAYGFEGSPLEVLAFLKDNPPPGAEKAPIFMGPDSQFSRAKYLQWLANPRVFDDPFMRMMEAQVSKSILPEQQIKPLLVALQPASDLELRFRLRMRSRRLWGAVVTADAQAFAVSPASISVAQARRWFDSHPDTLWHEKAEAVVPFVMFPKRPSHADSITARDQIDSVVRLARAGEKFEDLARNYSEDPGSAKNGGDLGGYQSLKNLVPEFADAARKLDSGKISDPVLSRFGWHAILGKGRKIENGDTLYSLAHVLVTIQTSPETSDSLKARAEAFRKLVKGGKSFAEAAKAMGLAVETSEPLVQGSRNSLSSGSVAGLNAFAFRNDETVSEVLENTQAVHVVGRGKVYSPGRDFELALPVIRQRLAQEAAVANAKAWLESQSAKIAACDTSVACLNAVGKLSATSYQDRPVASFLENFGYASPELLKLTTTTAKHQWSKVLAGSKAALMIKLDSAKVADEAEVTSNLALGRFNARNVVLSSAFNGWYKWRRSIADVDNRLDRYFRD